MKSRNSRQWMVAAATLAAAAMVASCTTGKGQGSTTAAMIISPRLIAGTAVKPAVSGLTFSPDGRTLAVQLENSLIQLRSSRTGKVFASFNPHEAENGNAPFAFSPNGKTLAVGIVAAKKCTIEFLSTRTMRPVRSLTPNVKSIYALAFSPDGKTLAMGAGTFLGLLNLATDTSIYVPDTAPGNMVGDNWDPEGEALHLSFSTNGNWLAVAGLQANVKLWNVRAGRFTKDVLVSPNGRGIPASADPIVLADNLSISPDGGTVAIGGEVTTVNNSYQGSGIWLWNTRTGAITNLIHGTIGPTDNTGIAGVAYNRQGTLLATSDDNGTIQIRNAANGKIVSTAYSPIIGYTDVAFSPDGKTLASGEWIQTSEENGLSGGLQLWDVYAPAAKYTPTTVTLSDLQSAPVPAACGHAAGTLAYGTDRGLGPGQGSMQLAWLGGGKTVETKLTAFGKIAGSNTVDVATVLVCNAGGSPWPQIIAFYGPGPKLLGWSYLTQFRLPGQQSGDNTDVSQISYHDGSISAEWSTQDAGDPDAIATLDYSASLRLVHGKIVATHLNATSDLQAAGQFLSDLHASNESAAATMASSGVAAEAAATFRSYPSALTASPACYGLNSFSMPAPISALTTEGGSSQVSPDTQRVCALRSSDPGAQWVVLGMRHIGYKKWQVLWLRAV